MKPFFADECFQDQLVALLCFDPIALRKAAPVLTPDDFKPLPTMRDGRPRWIVAERALEHYRKFREPLGDLLRSDVLHYADQLGLGQRQIAELEQYIAKLTKLKRTNPDAIVGRVVDYKRSHLRAQVLQQMVELQAAGKLTDQAWRELTDKVLQPVEETQPVDYFGTLENRLERRLLRPHGRVPWFFIDPLDALVRGIGPGEFGLVMGYTARGKSLMLAWLAVAYTLQRLNVLMFTLEDPITELEDRLDAAVTGIPKSRLHEDPNTVRQRFARFRRLVKAQLRLVDGTEGGFTVRQMEEVFLRERDRGFKADAIIIDYDDEIVPSRRYQERRLEFADIYRELRQLAGRYNIIVWTAAQTQRGTENVKILTSDRVAEDIGKVRKATLVLGLGKGDWGEDSIYIWVAKHKFDRQHVGCNIMPDKECMMIYDRIRTLEAQARYGQGIDYQEEEDDL
jgi:archaellum biogenesis ATPase FlaH